MTCVLGQESANWPFGHICLPPALVNKVLLEHNHSYFFLLGISYGWFCASATMRVESSPTSLEGPTIFQGFASLGHKAGSTDTNTVDIVSPCTQGIKPFYTRDMWILRFWYPEGFLKPIPCTYLRTIVVVTQIVYLPISIIIFWSFFGIKNYQCLLCGSEVKNPLAKAGDVVSIPWRSPGGGHGNPLHYS